MDYDRLITADDIKNPLHSEQIGAMTNHKGIQPIRDMLPMKRLVESTEK